MYLGTLKNPWEGNDRDFSKAHSKLVSNRGTSSLSYTFQKGIYFIIDGVLDIEFLEKKVGACKKEELYFKYWLGYF